MTDCHSLNLSHLFNTEPLTITRQPDELYRHTIGSSVYIKCETCPSTGVNYQWFKRKELLQGEYIYAASASMITHGILIMSKFSVMRIVGNLLQYCLFVQ